jgi:hypothetical protein
LAGGAAAALRPEFQHRSLAPFIGFGFVGRKQVRLRLLMAGSGQRG